MWEVNVRPPSCNKGVRPLEKLPLHVDYSGGSGIRIRIIGYGLRVSIKDQASNAKELARPLEKLMRRTSSLSPWAPTNQNHATPVRIDRLGW